MFLWERDEKREEKKRKEGKRRFSHREEGDKDFIYLLNWPVFSDLAQRRVLRITVDVVPHSLPSNAMPEDEMD